ncbi:hypothetical protein MIZ03_0961 [Rhodoferax lithotrophicus]|uniref:MetS family NSS transporter small subunit n=1 Tax=Rhodoferax lithotrophicus TaxID=2798804 RepID=A0ABN6D245_9BURK|nr:hypothetical protein MIZ03_0961 [Rhodoferax sp. MIZ03]
MDIVFALGAGLLWGIMVLFIRGFERLEPSIRGKS